MNLQTGIPRRSVLLTQPAFAAAVLVAFVLLGGSARADALSQLLIRPVAVFVIFAMLALAAPSVWKGYRATFAFMGALLGLVVIHVIPLPPAIWAMLPGRDVALQSYAAVGAVPGWQPLSLAPFEAWNSLFSLTVPLAMLMLAAAIDPVARAKLLPVLLGLVAVSAAIGMLQAVGIGGALYFYRITNADAAVGLFANRNHQALLLASAFPLLAAWVAMPGDVPRSRNEVVRRGIAALIAMLVLVPLIAVTGSRGGVALAAIGLVGSIMIAWIVIIPQHAKGGELRKWRWMAIGALAVLAAALALVWVLTRDAGVDAFGRAIGGDDLRLLALPTLLRAIADFFPFGSGAGSFVRVYQIYEPAALLSPNYFNHAHNDVVEVALEFGLPGVLLMATALLMWALAAKRLLARARHTSRPEPGLMVALAGLVLLAILGAGSVLDYPLRVPSLMALAALATIWVAGGLVPDSLTGQADGPLLGGGSSRKTR